MDEERKEILRLLLAKSRAVQKFGDERFSDYHLNLAREIRFAISILEKAFAIPSEEGK